MRFSLLALFLALSFAGTGLAHAYYDDSVVIEIGDVSPPEPSDTDSTSPQDSSQGGTGTGGSSDTGSGGTGESAGDGTGGSTSGGTSSGSAGGASSAEGTASENNPNDVNGTLFDLLVAQGAITGSGAPSSAAGGGAVTGNSTQNPNAGENTTGASANNVSTGNGESSAGGGASAGSEGNTTIDAAKLRATMRENTSFRQILADFSANVKSGGSGRNLSERDLGLMAASVALEHADIEELSFGATKFEIVYRSQGYLIGFIPKKFPVRISVDPQATFSTNRVNIALPWYRFFLRKLFSPSTLAGEIDALVVADVRVEGDTAHDVQGRLFDIVAALLKKKIGTVGESVRGG